MFFNPFLTSLLGLLSSILVPCSAIFTVTCNQPHTKTLSCLGAEPSCMLFAQLHHRTWIHEMWEGYQLIYWSYPCTLHVHRRNTYLSHTDRVYVFWFGLSHNDNKSLVMWGLWPSGAWVLIQTHSCITLFSVLFPSFTHPSHSLANH